ncbi:MAG: LOG family protein [Candidatus Hadarchaeum sp.]
MTDDATVVSVFGSSQVEPGSAAYEEARIVGGLLAKAGLIVCNGGYGGTMEAVSRGAKEAGGSVIGVTTSLFAHLAPNAWLDREVRTTTFLERLRTIIEMGQGYIALKGGVGTLTEVSTVWSMMQTRSIPPRPFVLLSDPWRGLIRFCAEALIIRPSDMAYLCLADSPDEAVHMLVESLKRQGNELHE